MHCTRLAPLLSATSRIDRIWIMALLLDRPRDEPNDLPALVFRDRAVLHDLDAIADLVLVLLVVRLVVFAVAHVLLVDGVARAPHDFDDDRLVHLVGHDFAEHAAAERVGLVLLKGRRGGRLRCGRCDGRGRRHRFRRFLLGGGFLPFRGLRSVVGHGYLLFSVFGLGFFAAGLCAGSAFALAFGACEAF